MTVPPIVIRHQVVNVLTNPTFTGDGTGWTKSQLAGVTDTGVTKDGVSALHVTLTTTVNGNTYLGDFSNAVVPGQAYTFHFYARAGESGRKIAARFLNASFVSPYTDVATDDWTPMSITVPAIPAGTTNASAIVLFDPATCQNGDEFWIVQPMLNVGTTPLPFVNGTRPAERAPGFLVPGTTPGPIHWR